MICKNCRHEYNSKFCPECGTKLEPNITDNNPRETVPATTVHSQITCTHCCETVDRNSIYCPFCHKMILQPLKCEKCGTENDIHNIYCTECHYQLQPDPNVENEKEQTKNYLKIGIACLSILVVLIIIISVSCGHKEEPKNINSVVSDTIYTFSWENDEEVTGIGGITEDDINNYFEENLANLGMHYSSIMDDGTYLITCFLNEDMQEWKSNHYSFAEEAVKVTKDFANKYHIDNVDLTVVFYSDDYTSIKWETTDFGVSGIYTDVEPINDYENIKRYSLKELREFYIQYNDNL